MKIKKSYLDKFDDKLRMKLMEANKRSFYTVNRWIKKNARQLTELDNIYIIADHFNKPTNSITTDK